MFHPYITILAGTKPSDSSGDWSLLRLSIEVPFGLKTAIKPCGGECLKESKDPNELTVGLGFSQAVGRLTVGLDTKPLELAALKAKLSSRKPKRYVLYAGLN